MNTKLFNILVTFSIHVHLTNEWDKVKCKVRLRRSWLAQVKFLKKELSLQDQVLGIKLIKKALDQRECEEFEMALQHTSKLQVYRELKWEIGFEEHLEYVKVAPSRLFLSFVQVPMGCLMTWVGMMGSGSQGLVRNQLSMFFLSMHHMIPRD